MYLNNNKPLTKYL